jgi:putative glycosyltransferase (TIGR04372 family)
MERLRTRVWRALVLVFSLVEVPLFLLRNREIFRNRILFPFYHWSFGHTVSGIDYASRLYWPHRISLLYLPHPNSNPLLPQLWQHNVDVFTLRSRLPFRSADIDLKRFAVLRFFALLIAGLRMHHYVIERLQIYRTLSLAEDVLMAGRPDTNRLQSVIDYTGYYRLLADGVGRDARLPLELEYRWSREIERAYPGFFGRPFVALALRRKGRGLGLHTELRDGGPAENYVQAVRWLVEQGYHVVVTGETEPEPFEGIDGVYTLADAAVSPMELNLFVFTRCALFIGQQSGAPILADAAGVPCLLTDNFPHRAGGFRREDVVLFKGVRDPATGRRLSLVELFRDLPDVAAGNIRAADVIVEPNTPDEILEAVTEAVGLVEGRLELTEEDEELAELFRSLFQSWMHIAWQGNRTTLAELRRLAPELRALRSTDSESVPVRSR